VAVLRGAGGGRGHDDLPHAGPGDPRLAEDLGGGPVTAIEHALPRSHPGLRAGYARGGDQHPEHLRTRDGAYWEGEAALTLPSDTFSDIHELRVGDKTVRSSTWATDHGQRPHDLFVEDNVLMTGNLLPLVIRTSIWRRGSVRSGSGRSTVLTRLRP
jgi:hypothetical protein